MSRKAVSSKYVPSCCRKPLRRDLFTLLPLPQQHPQQMLALLPRGSALEKALLSIKGCCSPCFQQQDVHKTQNNSPTQHEQHPQVCTQVPCDNSNISTWFKCHFFREKQRRQVTDPQGLPWVLSAVFIATPFPLLCLPHPHKTPQDWWTHQLATTDEGPGQPSISTVTLTKSHSRHLPFCDRQHGRGF